MLRCTLGSAAALIAGGLFLALPLAALAQEQNGDHKPPEQAQGEQKGDGQQKADEQAKAEQEAAAKAIAEYQEAAAKLASSAGAPECVWTGRRITSLLWRDDVDTARRYMDLYDRFNCSSEHLKLAFRCVVEQGPLDPKAADRLASRVHNCWVTPQRETTAATQTPAGPTIKNGTIPN